MTGDYANYGILISQGVKLAVEEQNAKGGINGAPIELIVEDSEGSPEKGAASFDKLYSSDKVCALVGPVFTGVSFTVGDLCQENGLTMITPSATHKDITAAGEYVFRTVVSDGLQGEVAGAYFYEVLGYRNLGCLYIMNDYSQGLYEGMKASFESCGGKVSAVETAQLGDKDFRTQLTRLKASGVEAIYIPNYTAEMAQQLEQASQLGIDIPFLSCDGFSNPEIYDLAGDYTDGVLYIGPAQVEESDSYKNFVNNYSAKFGQAPDSFATNAYDASYVLFAALEKAGTDRKAIRDAVAATKDFQGVTGTVNFAENGDLVAYQGVYKVNGKTPEYLGAYTVVGGKLQEVK
jgi:ABC-type branched-chain amino acid transport systems, periplasmic component